MDAMKNFAYSRLAAGITATQLTGVLITGEGSRFPATGEFNVIIYDSIYPTSASAYHSGKAAIYRVLSRTSDTLTFKAVGGVREAQEGTTALAHNTAEKTYIVALHLTSKIFDDLDDALALKADKTAIDLATKPPCRVASTGNIDIATGGIPSSSLLDGVTVINDNRVFLRAQTNPAENGIYPVNASGAWTRALDFATSAQVKGGCLIAVSEGTLYGNSVFFLTTNDPIILGTTELVFALPALPSYYLVDAGAANAISVTVPAVPPLTSWDQLIGVRLAIKIIAANTGATTIAVVGLTGTKAVTKYVSSALSTDDLLANGIYEFIYTGVDFKLMIGQKGDQGASGGIGNVAAPSNMLFVSPGFSALSSPYFSDLQTAINAASAGQTIKVFPATYNLAANSLTLKNGVNFNYETGVTITSDNATATITDGGSTVVCKMEGNPTIINTNGQQYAFSKIAGSYFGFTAIYSAVIQQSGTNAPTILQGSVFENNLQITPTLARIDTGNYTATHGGLPFISFKGKCWINQVKTGKVTYPIPASELRHLYAYLTVSSNPMYITCLDQTGALVDTWHAAFGFEILI